MGVSADTYSQPYIHTSEPRAVTQKNGPCPAVREGPPKASLKNAALEAYAAVIGNDFEEPMSVSQAKAIWRKNSNPVACWAEERLERAMLAELQSKPAYEDFNKWCDENGHKLTLTQTTFSERLKLLGYEKIRKNKAVFWRDVQLV